jgi:phospholipase C
VIVIIGENRTFDHVYGTFKPKHGQTVSNLLSRRIVTIQRRTGNQLWALGAVQRYR